MVYIYLLFLSVVFSLLIFSILLELDDAAIDRHGNGNGNSNQNNLNGRDEVITFTSSSSPNNHNYKHYHSHSVNKTKVEVFYYVSQDWDAGVSDGVFDCSIPCHWTKYSHAATFYQDITKKIPSHNTDTLNIAVYNLYAWKDVYQRLRPSNVLPLCNVPIDYHLVEILEAIIRTPMFATSSHYFDASSSTLPTSTIQELYPEAYLPNDHFLPIQPYQNILPVISIFVSNCNALSKRNDIYYTLKQFFRIDGFGYCFPTIFNEGMIPKNVTLTEWNHLIDRNTNNNENELRLRKLKLLNYYMFHLAFENTIEDGYITEKVFHALMAGSIPIYLGDSNTLRQLLDYTINGVNLKDSVIYIDDFFKPSLKSSLSSWSKKAEALTSLENIDFPRLVDYLQSIMKNQTKYESFWKWRVDFSSIKYQQHHPLLKSWQCRVCEWGDQQYRNQTQNNNHHHHRLKRKESCYHFPPA